MSRTSLTIWTWTAILILILIFSALSVVGCPAPAIEARQKQEAQCEKDTGNKDLQIVEFNRNGKHYTILLWHNHHGSDMEILEVRDVEIRSDVHTD